MNTICKRDYFDKEKNGTTERQKGALTLPVNFSLKKKPEAN